MLVLLDGMGQNLDGGCLLFAEFVNVLVPFLNLLIQRLILDFQLLEIDQMKPLCELLLLFELLLVLGEISSELEDIQPQFLELNHDKLRILK